MLNFKKPFKRKNDGVFWRKVFCLFTKHFLRKTIYTAMRKKTAQWSTLLLLLLLANSTFAQAQAGAEGSSMNLVYALGVLLLFIAAMWVFGGNDFKKGNGKSISLKQGHNIELNGAAGNNINDKVKANTFAIRPPDFFYISPIPKVTVAVGDTVKAGDTIFFDKKQPTIKYASPVSGKVKAINRGEKRSIAEVIIESDNNYTTRTYTAFDIEKENREALVSYLLDSGVWPMIKQRPYNIVANPEEAPVNIFVSTFDTAPLAPNLNLVVEGKEAAFQKGLDVLGKLTSGKVHVGVDGNGITPSTAFSDAKGVETQIFKGKHPIGNVGIQIHHTAPVSNNAIVWTLGVQEVITMGMLFLEQRFDASRTVVIVGEVNAPQYVKTYQGANIGDLVKNNLKEGNLRLISGDILSGKKKDKTQFLAFYDDQISVIKEGDYFEMFGWMVPHTKRPTVSKTFLGGLMPARKVDADTNTHGEKRAFVVTGEYEAMLPMDMYPQHLFKNIIIGDLEKMEGLGIYEVVEEDVALCEFACTSKQPLQQILREGLTEMQSQG